MSDDLGLSQYGELSHGFPSERLHEPPKREDPIVENDDRASIQEVANRISERWKSEGKSADSENPMIDRRYVNADGSDVPPDKIVTVKEVGHDLGHVHKVEAEHHQQQADAELASKVDDARTQWHYENNPEFRAQADALIQQQAQEQQQAPSVEQQQPEAQRADPHADPLAAAWQATPEPVKKALEAQVADVQKAQQAYVEAAAQQAKFVARSIFHDFPELQNCSPEQMQAVVNSHAQRDPARAAAIQARVHDAIALANASQQAQAQMAQRQQEVSSAQWKSYAREQDKIFDESIAKEFSEAEATQIKREAARVAKEAYGIDQEQLLKEYDSNPAVRDARFQRALFDAVRHRLAMKGVAHADRPNVPPVQRPGTYRGFSNGADENIAALERKLAKTGSMKDATALRVAKLRARG